MAAGKNGRIIFLFESTSFRVPPTNFSAATTPERTTAAIP
jgi:hypothetical protein